jgi:hypothetical protein
LDAPPLVGFSTGAVIFVIVFRCCPADFFRHLARRGLRKNLCPGIKRSENFKQEFRS